eukprot:SAG11_NODE_22146_length_411_cov_0.830128_1_plen_21_part_01
MASEGGGLEGASAEPTLQIDV